MPKVIGPGSRYDAAMLSLLMFCAGVAIWLYLGSLYSPPREHTRLLGDIGPDINR